MDANQVLTEVKAKLAQATDHFKEELGKLRTGRAHPSMLDGIMVEAYGTPMPLKATASIMVPEATLLQITPFDPANLQPIVEAIKADQSLGLSPTDDGRVIRINLPPMTAENREQMVKVLGQKVEETMIAARNARHEAMHKAEQAEKSKEISKDDHFSLQKQVDELMAKHKEEIDKLAAAKEQEIRTV